MTDKAEGKAEDRTEERASRASESGAAKGASGGVQSVDRAVSVMEILAQHGEVGVTEIADELNVHKSTAFRLLGVLENRGLVAQEQERGKYYLGAGVLRLAGAAAARLDISQEGAPVCRDLASEAGETANIAVLDDDAAVNIMQARGTSSVTAQNWLGRRTPLHATSSGKVLLAHQSKSVRESVLARKLARITDRTVSVAGELRAQLDEVRENGFAVAMDELEVGLHAVAAPVHAHDGDVIGAISVSGPAYRLEGETFEELIKCTLAASTELSRRMGYRF